MFKIEVENDKGIWSDVYGDDGKLLTFETGGGGARSPGGALIRFW